MNVGLQILKHLPRNAHPTVAIIDTYGAEYKELFKGSKKQRSASNTYTWE
jgi:hypothetical protein